MKKAQSFRDLIVWQKAHQVVLAIYKITRDFPAEERYGLMSQLRRSALSVPANIVEGFKRRGKKDYAHFINMAEGSLEETRYHILIAKDLGYIGEQDFRELSDYCAEISKILHVLYRKICL